MRFFRYAMISCLMLAAMAVMAKDNTKQTVYMFGFSASFNDSIIYFTPLQKVDAYIAGNRTHFLVDRDQYSNQLRNFFDNRGQLNRTCVTIFSTDKAKAEKKYEKMKEKYTGKNKNRYDINYLTDDDFKFSTVEPNEGVEYVDSRKEEAASMTKRKEKENHGGHDGDAPVRIPMDKPAH